jgi:hypothetical protein
VKPRGSQNNAPTTLYHEYRALDRASVVGLKEWAYADIAFDLTRAAFAWALVGDSDTLGG